MRFRYFVIISPLKGAWLFILTNLNPQHPRMLCAKFGWNWPSGSGEDYENVKSLQTDKPTMDNRRLEKLTLAFSSVELSKNHIFTKLILKCESCIENWISPTFLIGCYLYMGPGLYVLDATFVKCNKCSCRTVALRKNFCWQTGELSGLSKFFFPRATVLQLQQMKHTSHTSLIEIYLPIICIHIHTE